MAADPVTVARRLLGQTLVRIGPDGTRLAGLIVETEAYLGAPDRAAHTFGGRRTARNQSMYLPGGHAYVYFTYGMHFCMNVVCGRRDEGVAALIRALEPVDGLEVMRRLRKAKSDRDLCSGPARLTQALIIDRALDGVNMLESEVLFIERTQLRVLPESRIAAGPRIGLNPAATGEWANKPLRFWVAGNPHVSR